jgi:hypothetical protein
MGGKRLGLGDCEQRTAKKQTKREQLLVAKDKVMSGILLIVPPDPFNP